MLAKSSLEGTLAAVRQRELGSATFEVGIHIKCSQHNYTQLDAGAYTVQCRSCAIGTVL